MSNWCNVLVKFENFSANKGKLKAEGTLIMKGEIEQLRQENHYLKQLLVKLMNRENVNVPGTIVSKQSTLVEKIHLNRNLFKWRIEVYALSWESQSGSNGYTPACALEWKKPICQKPVNHVISISTVNCFL